MNKWLILLAAMRQGAVVADPVSWKNRQVLVSAVAGTVVAGVAFAKAVGWIAIEVDAGALSEIGIAIGAALFGIYNIVSTVGSTDKIGLPGLTPAGPPPEPELPDGEGAAGGSNPFL
jgi:hypothetical protein